MAKNKKFRNTQSSAEKTRAALRALDQRRLPHVSSSRVPQSENGKPLEISNSGEEVILFTSDQAQTEDVKEIHLPQRELTPGEREFISDVDNYVEIGDRILDITAQGLRHIQKVNEVFEDMNNGRYVTPRMAGSFIRNHVRTYPDSTVVWRELGPKLDPSLHPKQYTRKLVNAVANGWQLTERTQKGLRISVGRNALADAINLGIERSGVFGPPSKER